ncbi:MAG: 16S rRNA (adenine(1518)-N(6)/adenine(1519)-N(6))-dimethyltransferase RsmA [Thermaurantimonas sp.]
MTGIKPKKHFGQHFLTNKQIAADIASLAENAGCNRILEVGPGTGVLTAHLHKMCEELIAVEIDRESVEYLTSAFPGLHVVQGDFLKHDVRQYFDGKEFAVVGNFPYNISSQIIFKILDYRHLIPFLAGMFQREVALRIGSPPGSKDYGILSVLTQLFYEVVYHFTVEPGNFNPPPKVRSGVISMKRREAPLCDDLAFASVKLVVKTAFNQRRKTLRNALKTLNIQSESVEDSIFDRRAEQLSPTEFVELSKALILEH